MATMQKELKTELEANEELEEREDLALEDARPLAEELHGVTDQSLRENLPEATYQAYFAPQQQLGGEAEQENDPAPVILSSTQVDAVVKGINSIAVKTVEKGKMEIGEYVLSVVFMDDLKAVSSQNPYKNSSLSEIAKHPDLLVDRRQLGTWVRAAAFRRKLVQAGVDCTHLTYSHFAAFFRLKKEEKQIELAKEVSRDNLSVRQILDRIESSKNGKPSNQPHKDLLKKVEDPFKLMEDKEATDLLSDPEKLAELTSGDRVDIVKAIDKTELQINKSQKFLRQAKKDILQIELGPYQEPEV